MATVRSSSASSACLVCISQERGADLAGFETTQTQIGVVNLTSGDIVIPAGSTLYLTVVSNRRGEDGVVTARCVDVRVWTATGDRSATVVG
jgi:hypothetical protein